MTDAPIFLPSGDRGLVVQFAERIEPEASAKALALAGLIERETPPGVVDCVPTYRSTLLHYDPLETSAAALRAWLEGRLDNLATTRPAEARRFRLPICFDGADFAPDLSEVAASAGIGEDALITAFLGSSQRVYMLGFGPGQPYMGDLPAVLDLPRRKSPTKAIPVGSVVIAQAKTVLYPVSNPTGWWRIGRTPAPLFTPDDEEPTLLRAGDEVSFERVDRDAYGTLEQGVERGVWRPEPQATTPGAAPRAAP